MTTREKPETFERPDNLPLADGTYRLTRELPAQRPDKRKRHDWKANVVKAGTVFCVQWDQYFGFQRVWPQGDFESQGLRTDRAPELCAALEPMPEEPTDWLNREHAGRIIAGSILDVLVREGKITLADVKEAVERIPS